MTPTMIEPLASVAHADFATRMNTLKALANQTGIRLPNTIVREGESLLPMGKDRQRQLQEDIYKLPTIGEAASFMHALHREQSPLDTTIALQSVRMDDSNGGLYGAGLVTDRSLSYSPTAFNQIASAIRPDSVTMGFGQTLAALPPEIRAQAFNHFVTRSTADERVVLRTIMSPQSRNGEVGLRRSLRAVVSERYSVMNDHELMDDINAALPDGARCRITQTESRTDVEILWPAMSRQLQVGDVALIALHISNSQTKQGAIKIIPKLLRVLCYNFTTAWGEGVEEEVSIIHMGDVRRKFAQAVRRALSAVEPFVIAFGDAYQDAFPVFAPTRGEVVARAVKALELPKGFGEQIVTQWDMDGVQTAGDTRAGLINAMTRASQELTIERATVIERAAGQLVCNGWEVLA